MHHSKLELTSGSIGEPLGPLCREFSDGSRAMSTSPRLPDLAAEDNAASSQLTCLPRGTQVASQDGLSLTEPA